jgi:hypothetical protein
MNNVGVTRGLEGVDRALVDTFKKDDFEFLFWE